MADRRRQAEFTAPPLLGASWARAISTGCAWRCWDRLGCMRNLLPRSGPRVRACATAPSHRCDGDGYLQAQGGRFALGPLWAAARRRSTRSTSSITASFRLRAHRHSPPRRSCGRAESSGALRRASLVALLPNLLSNRTLFQVISGWILAGLFAASGDWCARRCRPSRRARRFWRRRAGRGGLLVGQHEALAQGHLRLCSSRSWWACPKGLMGFASRFLSRLFRIPDPPLPGALPSRRGRFPRLR